jgi:putative membrane protein
MDLSLVAKSLSNLPVFLAFFAVCIALVALFLFVYSKLTPYDERRLIREGNVAAAWSLGGALIGFCLPLANIVAHSNVLVDVVVWGIVALVVQIAVWWVVDKLMPGKHNRVQSGDAASGVFLGATSIAVGIINAGCMTY